MLSILRRLLALTILCGSLHATVFDGRLFAQDSEQAEVPAAAGEKVAVDGVAEDSKIADRLGQIFRSTQWYKDVNVKVDNGVVILEGTADSDEHRRWAEDVAHRTQDVVAIVNRLQVESVVDLDGSASVVSDSLWQLWRDFLKRSPLLIAALFVLFITWVAARSIGWLVHRVLGNRRIRDSLKDLMYQLTIIGVWIVGFLVATVIAFPGMTPSKALTVLGLGSVAIGFAFKDIFENFFAGILILWRYPFDRGDFITAGDLTGRVVEITIRNTLIRRLDGELSIVPNAQLFKSSVDVLTDKSVRRVRLICGVAYDEDVDVAREVITKAVSACDSVESGRDVEVFAQAFADSSVNFEVAWWTGSQPTQIRSSRDEVVASIKRALDDAEIEIPFPYRTLTFKEPALERAVIEQSKNVFEQTKQESLT
tara:strand:- start:72593 stop:73864 length:1272 start_codon:yes stop_codon:yes gene_type:complete